jgi:CheY-like chemotaxis protein
MTSKVVDETSKLEETAPPAGAADAVFDSLPAACLETSKTGFIKRANDEAALIFNVSRVFCAGRPLVGFVARGDVPALRKVTRVAFDSALVERVALRVRPRHGRPVALVDASVRRVDESLLWVLQPFPEQALLNAQVVPRRVLYVEDDTDIREMLEEILMAEGFTVRTAATLEEARAAFDASSFDVVITNYQLPDGDGTSFIESLGEHRLRGARVVMLTGHPRARRLQGIPCWMKPIDPSSVAARVRLLLAKR